MKRFLAAILVLVPLLALALPAAAQTDPEATLFVGYSYLRTDVGSDDGDAHGIQGEYTYFADRHVGFTISGAIHWGELAAPPNIFVVDEYDVQQITLLAGPSFVLWRGLTSELDLSVLGGAARRKIDVADFGADVSTEWAAAGGINLALDFRLGDQIWLRAAEPGVLFTHFDDEWRADFRVAVGLVLRAGEILQ